MTTGGENRYLGKTEVILEDLMGSAQMRRLFYPERVAVIGVSPRQENLGRNIVENLFRFRFTGEVFSVGRRGGVVFGRRVLGSVEELPEGVDLAIVLTPAFTVPSIVRECGRKGIRWVIVETGGFGEYSEEGKRLEEELLRAAEEEGVRLVGPNCIGVINMENGLVSPFFPFSEQALRRGKVGIISQSGGVVFALINLLASSNIGVSKVISMGNKLDLNEIDFLSYLVEDEETDIVVLYLESLADGRKLMEIARGTKKPIIVQKVNIYPSASQIARFHTAALATDDRVVDAALRQAGMIRAHDYRQVVNLVKIFSIPPMRGNNLVIISRTGGVAVAAADFAAEEGFHLYPLPESFLSRVKEAFRAKVITPTNPLDVGDLFDFNFYTQITEEVLKEEGVDGVLFQHAAAPGLETEESIKLGQAFDRLAAKYQKPIALCFLSDEQSIAFVKKSLNYPMFTEPGEALPALATSRDTYRKQRERGPERSFPSFPLPQQVSDIIQGACSADRPLFLDEALRLVEAIGIRVAPYFVVEEVKEALLKAEELGYPVVLKLNLPCSIHKTELGAVIPHIRGEEELKRGFAELKGIKREDIAPRGILVQKEVSEGVEMIIGGKRDKDFGPVLMLGLGGIYTEVLQDISLRISPLSEGDAQEMIRELKGYPILAGERSTSSRDIPFLKEALLRLSSLMFSLPQLEEIEINPLFLLAEGEGGMAADARLRIEEG